MDEKDDATAHRQPSYLDMRDSETTTSDPSRDKTAKANDDDDDTTSSLTTTTSSSSSSLQRHDRRTSRSPTVRLTRSISEVRDGIATHHEIPLLDQEGAAAAAAIDFPPGSDLEKKPTPITATNNNTATAAAAAANPNRVTWREDADDPENPKTWPFSQKWAAVAIVSFFTLISPVSSSMTAPALDVIGAELHMTSAIQKELSLSIFILAYAVGPLLLGPLSEIYGRVLVLQCANLFYLFFNLGCGLARNPAELIAFRFLAGFGGSAPLAIGGGVLSDLFTAEQRGRAMSLYSLAPLLGPAIGPLAGAFISQHISWRWIFYVTTIADAAIQCAGLFLLRETYAPVLLRWRKERLIKETGNTALYTDYDDASASVLRKLATASVRPFRMLLTQPIIQVLGLYMMYLYGLMYLVLSTFPTLWTQTYHVSTSTAGLHYLALGIGLFLGAQACAPLQDRIYAALKRRYNTPLVGRPEFRVPLMLPGAVLLPIGLLVYGWTAQYHTAWIGPDIGVAVLAIGTIIGFQCIQGFLVDTYARYAASAVAAATVLRSLAGFGFPLFAPSLYARLGYGWGNTLLAGVGVVIGWPGPILLWKYGPALRARSTFAAGG